jgi:RNA polymerase sigma-70 factor (ECF subfamily)
MSRFVWHNDRESYEELVSRWDQRLFSFLVKASSDIEVAKDLRQEVFIRMFKYSTTFDAEQSFPVWLFQIARNTLASWYAKSKRSKLLEIPGSYDAMFSVADTSRNPSAEAMVSEKKYFVNQVIARLTPYERELLLLRMELNLSYREISEILDAPETTIKSRIYSLLGRIRKELQSTPLVEELGDLKPIERMP